GAPLKPEYRTGFEYSDCWVDDARLVALNAVDACERGAAIRTRTEVVAGRRENDLWHLDVTDRLSGKSGEVRARALVNAAGPWVSQVSETVLGVAPRARERLVKGSHIVT